MKRTRQLWIRAGIGVAIALLVLGYGAYERGVPTMNEQERRTLEGYTQTMRPVCVGRFQLQMPERMPLSSSSLTVNEAQISARPMSRQMYDRFIEKRRNTFENQETVNKDDAPYLKNVIKTDSGLVIFDRNESRSAYDSSRTLEGYKFEGFTMFSVELKATDLTDERYKADRAYLTTNKSERLKQVQHLLQRLHPRESDEIPERPGLCFGHGFLAGGADETIPGAALPYREESIGMTFVDNVHEDIYLNIYTNTTIAAETTLLERKPGVIALLSRDPNHSMLRDGKVDLEGIKQAEEVLTTGTTDEDVRGHYFNIEANSRIGSPETPYVDITLRTGEFVTDGTHPRIDQASLTDAEAAGLWDAVTRTFHPRPNAF
ncbi:hypothetical protein KBTX_01730 [wastewater metagenome]|uniref:Tle cognate immunity protein 4 C-terminal domain-containing protein n=4 Tax=root TaxID=1 RepID=A0A5B8R8F8_9ZZZZ|nr:hypothetical protein KBTEX_01730 [uncultured organism]